MARTLVNSQQLAPFSGSTAVQIKVDAGLFPGPDSGDAKDASLNMTSGSITEVGTIYFSNGTTGVAGSVAYESSAFQFYGGARMQGNLDVVGTISGDTSLTLDAVTITTAEIGVLDGVTAGTAAASKAMVLDASADITGARHITISGELDAASGDFSGDIDVDGTANLDAVDIDGTVQIDGATTFGVDDTGVDVKMFGATSGRYLLWDESRDALAAPDNVKFEIGSGQDMELYHDGTDSFLQNKTGIMNIANATSGIPVNIGHSTSEVTIGDNLTVTGNLTVQGTTTTVDVEVIQSANGVIFEGATADANELTLKAVDPTADRTVQIADAAGFLIPFAAVSTTQISSTPEELNKLDGASADVTAAKLNKLAALTNTEIDFLDGSSAGAALASKAVVLDASKDVSGLNIVTGADYIATNDVVARNDLFVSGSTTLGSDGADTTSFASMVTASFGMAVFGEEGADGVLHIAADEADDAADRWSLTAMASAGRFELRSGGGNNSPFVALSSGDCTVLGDLTISGDDLIMGTNTSGYMLVADGTSYNPVAISGDVTMAANGAVTIANDAVEAAMLNDNVISGQTALNSAGVAQADEFLFSDAGTVKKVTFSNLEDSIFGNISGDATVAAGGALTIAAGAVEHGMLAEDIISGQDELAHADIADADELMISDNGVIKRVGVDSLRDHFFGVVSGDATVADGGALTIAAGAVEHSMLNDNCISGKTNLGSTGVDDADEFLFSDAGTIKALTGANLYGWMFSKISGDATVSNAGALTIAAASVEGSMLNDNAISGRNDIGATLQLTDELLVSDGGVLKRMDVSRLAEPMAGGGLRHSAGTLAVDIEIDTVRGSSGHNYNSTTGVYTLSENAASGSELVFLNGQVLAPAADLAAGDYTTATGSVELHPDLKLDGDDVLRVWYLGE